MVVQIAASQIWRGSHGDPCWSKLDVEALARQVASSPLAAMADDVMLTLHAFYTFLWLHGHVSQRKVEHILGALDLYTAPVAARLGLAAAPVDWGPS
jgi:alpha-D-ribose 1-methylphosphonate 5-triphosphate synthase subunit PhnH